LFITLNVTSLARATIVTIVHFDPDTAAWRASLAVTLAGCFACNASLLAPSEATASFYPAPSLAPKAGDRLQKEWNTPHRGIYPCPFRGLFSLTAWRAV
jgi:hypothetical protein